MVQFRMTQQVKQETPCPKWLDLKADIASSCSLVVLKGFEILTYPFIFGHTGVISAITVISSKERR